MRTLVIGDIHGGLKALEDVLNHVDPQPEDSFIFLGDYVDGWSQAAETVGFLINFDRHYSCHFLRGNHDDLCLQWLTEGVEYPLWLLSGGEATKNSYNGLGKETRKEHIRFLQSLQDYHLNDRNQLFLHAGFTNLKGVEHEYYKQSFYWDRTLWETALSLDPKLGKNNPLYPSRLKHYLEIFIGHTPVTHLGFQTPLKAANIWNLDTGAAFRGPLSVMEASTKQLWQSQEVHTYYPGERGRN